MAIIEAIETLYLEADVASVSFDSIAGYEHLQLHYSAVTNAGYDWEAVTLRFNDDSAANYVYRQFYAYSTTKASFGSNGNEARLVWISSTYSNSVGPTGQGAGFITIADYLNANKNTSVLAVGGVNNRVGASRGMQGTTMANWDNTAALTKITLIPQTGSWMRSSMFTLYGIKSS